MKTRLLKTIRSNFIIEYKPITSSVFGPTLEIELTLKEPPKWPERAKEMPQNFSSIDVAIYHATKYIWGEKKFKKKYKTAITRRRIRRDKDKTNKALKQHVSALLRDEYKDLIK